MSVALETPDLPPFTPEVVAQIADLESAASALQAFFEQLTNYINSLKDALDADLEAINGALP